MPALHAASGVAYTCCLSLGPPLCRDRACSTGWRGTAVSAVPSNGHRAGGTMTSAVSRARPRVAPPMPAHPAGRPRSPSSLEFAHRFRGKSQNGFAGTPPKRCARGTPSSRVRQPTASQPESFHERAIRESTLRSTPRRLPAQVHTSCRPHRTSRLAPTTPLESTCTPRVCRWMERARLEDRSLLKDADTRTASIQKLAGRRVRQLAQGLRQRRSSVSGQDFSRRRASGYKTVL